MRGGGSSTSNWYKAQQTQQSNMSWKPGLLKFHTLSLTFSFSLGIKSDDGFVGRKWKRYINSQKMSWIIFSNNQWNPPIFYSFFFFLTCNVEYDKRAEYPHTQTWLASICWYLLLFFFPPLASPALQHSHSHRPTILFPTP